MQKVKRENLELTENRPELAGFTLNFLHQEEFLDTEIKFVV
jgi:hypothetical protein